MNAAAAALTKGFINKTTITLADIKVNDHILIGGTLAGSVITATAVNDVGDLGSFSCAHNK